MNRRNFLTTALIAVTPLLAQNAPRKPPASPPATASATIGGKNISIAYSSPGVKGPRRHSSSARMDASARSALSGVARGSELRPPR